MDTITKTAPQRMERFRQKQMTPDESTQPALDYAANYFDESDKEYSTSKLRVPAVFQLQMDNDTPSPAPTTFGELIEYLDIGPGISQIPQGTTRAGSNDMRLGSGTLHSKTSIPSLAPSTEPDLPHFLIAKPSEPVSCYPSIWPPQRITI